MLFLWYNYVVGPMARPGTRGLGPGLGLKYDKCVAGRVGPGHTFCGPGPGLIIQFAGRARAGSACTTAACPGRSWALNHICGPGLSLNFMPVQGPSLRHNRNYVKATTEYVGLDEYGVDFSSSIVDTMCFSKILFYLASQF